MQEAARLQELYALCIMAGQRRRPADEIPQPNQIDQAFPCNSFVYAYITRKIGWVSKMRRKGSASREFALPLKSVSRVETNKSRTNR